MRQMCLFAGLFLAMGGTVFGQNFASLDEGLDRNVYTLFDDSSNDVLLVTGDFVFDATDQVPLGGTAMWNGSAWMPTPFSDTNCLNGSGCPTRQDLVRYQGNLICALTDNTQPQDAYYIVEWDGSAFDTLAELDQEVQRLKIIGDDLYAMGWFTEVNGASVNLISRWDGSQWHGLNFQSANPGGAIYDLISFNGQLVACGNFEVPGGPNEIGVFNGVSWENLGGGLLGNSSASALEVFQNELIVGGFFKAEDGNAADFLMRWNGSEWRPLGSGLAGADGTANTNGQVHALKVWNDYLFVGGAFSYAGGLHTPYLTRWDGQSFCRLGSLTNRARVLGAFQNNLMIGMVGEADNVPFEYIGQWQGGSQTDSCNMPTSVFNPHPVASSISLFPNPSTGTITIQTTDHQWTTPTLQVIDLLGQTVYQQPINLINHRVDLDLSHLAAGTYRVTLTGSGFATATLIIAE